MPKKPEFGRYRPRPDERGLGKVGGGELNYSSDIDLILLYDRQIVAARDPYAIPSHMTNLARRFVSLLASPTAQGRVFPVDLRLRPDPVSMPLVIPTHVALQYYDKRGQTWERAAMIKARPIAGDHPAAETYLKQLEAFVWPEKLDFATVQDLHDTKVRIDMQHRGGKIGEPGQNLKLGRGGIREIEFFAQAHQLAWGGADPSLRTVATCASLQALVAAGRIAEDTRTKLTAAYEFLRRTEHRIQMVADRQTHSLPKGPAELETLARFLGFAGSEPFRDALVRHLRHVEEQYESFFELPREMTDASASSALSKRSRTETVAGLERMGYRDPEAAFSIIERWRTGRHVVARDTRGLNLLQSMIPSLVIATCGTEDPDLALRRFDDVIDGIQDAQHMLTLFQANLHVMETVAEIMVATPVISDLLTARPTLLEVLLDPWTDSSPPDREALAAQLASKLGDSETFDDALSALAEWVDTARFRVSFQVLFHTLDPLEAPALLTDIADCAMQALMERADAETGALDGPLEGGGVAFVALGGFGSRALTPGSGLELAIYYCEPQTGPSAASPAASGREYAQQLGALVLTGLRGKAERRQIYACAANEGPQPLDALENTLRGQGWKAIPRGWPRLVCTSGEISDRVAGIMSKCLQAPRDADQLRAELIVALDQLQRDRTRAHPWHVEARPGGLADLRVLTHYLRLRHGAEHAEILAANTEIAALGAVKNAGAISVADGQALIDAWLLWTRVQALQGLVSHDAHAENVPERLKALFRDAAGVDAFTSVEARMDEAATAVQAIIGRVSAAGD